MSPMRVIDASAATDGGATTAQLPRVRKDIKLIWTGIISFRRMLTREAETAGTWPHAEPSRPTGRATKRASAARLIRAIIFLNRSLSRRHP
jgi:hypothetical protein